jgi:nicotinate-nucleotide adenylyltransferase
MKHIGIMGGTFNPIHYGHLFAAEAVYDTLKLDSVLFIPTGNPPHKKNSELIHKDHRYNMLKLAISDNEKFESSDIEINRVGITYTVDTLRELHKLYYGNCFYFIIGFDTLRELSTWKEISTVCELCSFVVVNRNSPSEILEAEVNLIKNKLPATIEMVTIPNLDISSSHIRDNLYNNKSVKYLMPTEVIDYIKNNNLYMR